MLSAAPCSRCNGIHQRQTEPEPSKLRANAVSTCSTASGSRDVVIGTPMPSSATADTTPLCGSARDRSHLDLDALPFELNLMAFPHRLISICFGMRSSA